MGLVDIVAEGRQADEVRLATETLLGMGSEATAHVIGRLVGPDRLEKETQARLRALTPCAHVTPPARRRLP